MDMSYEDFLEHHGIKGQKWGDRKYQYEDGSLTPAGRIHYGVGKARDAAVTAVKKVAKATGNVAKKVAIATGHGVAKVGKATAHKVGEIHEKHKAEKREQKIRDWSTSLEELNKHQTELTDDEYREALSRANMNRQLSELKKAELDRGLSYLKSAALATGDTLMIANNVSKMITGKSFEDLRKAPSEKDKIELEIKRTELDVKKNALESQYAITDTNRSKLREQENKEAAAKAKSDLEYQKLKRDDDADAIENRMHRRTLDIQDALSKDAYREAKAERLNDSAQQARDRQHRQELAESRRIAAEKAAETRSANKYRQEMRSTPEYKTIFNRLDKAYTNTMEEYYRKQGDSAAEAKKKAKEYVERMADKWLDDDLSLSVFDDPNYLEHHGIKGQQWGVRRYQNLDGSLTEEGKLHRQKYITRETERNNAYYSKYETKYQKLADKAKDDETRAQYLAMKADATKSKNQVNEYLKNMSMDEILANEKESRDKALSTAGKVAKVGLMGISMAGGAAGIATGLRAGVAGATMAVNFLSNPDNQAMLINNAMKYAEMGIRTAVDIKQWATGVVIDEVANNLGKYTNPEDFRTIGETAGKAVKALTDGFSSQAGDAVSKATEKVTEAAVRGAAKAVEEHGGDTAEAALRVAAELARESARTSGDVAGDVATTAENVSDIVDMITDAVDKVKHSADQDPNFLAHHGIKGQRWGIRRFQNEDGSLTKAGHERYAIGSAKSGAKSVTFDPSKVDHHADDNTWKKKGYMATKIAIDVLTLNPIALTSDIVELGKVAHAAAKTSRIEKERSKNTNIDKKTGLRLKQKEFTEKEDLKRVNPGFNNWNSNTKSNCMLCTTAYDMRRRGYDVKAKTASIGYQYDDVKTWYPKAEVKKVDFKYKATEALGLTHGLRKAAKNEILKQGNGARGNIMVTWKSGGGHSMCYEVVNNKLVIRCPQSNKTWNDAQILNHCTTVSYARLDNVDFDPKKIKEAVE